MNKTGASRPDVFVPTAYPGGHTGRRMEECDKRRNAEHNKAWSHNPEPYRLLSGGEGKRSGQMGYRALARCLSGRCGLRTRRTRSNVPLRSGARRHRPDPPWRRGRRRQRNSFPRETFPALGAVDSLLTVDLLATRAASRRAAKRRGDQDDRDDDHPAQQVAVVLGQTCRDNRVDRTPPRRINI